jgi:hypothetical protein
MQGSESGLPFPLKHPRNTPPTAPLDNLRISQVGARSLAHHIDASTNRLTSLSGSQAISLGYDANGNVTQRGSQGYSFDIANRMRRAHGKALYDYDGHGRRGWVVYDNGNTQLNAYTGLGAAGCCGSGARRHH